MDNEHPLGSEQNPVRCFQPAGERHYLSQLVGPHGEPLDHTRLGSVGKGPHGSPLDIYHITSAHGTVDLTIHMDMYHEGHQERRAVPGLRTRSEMKRPKHWQDPAYLEARSRELLGQGDKESPAHFAYIWTKAGSLLAIGPWLYAHEDALEYPEPHWNLQAIQEGCHRIVHDLFGCAPERPIPMPDLAASQQLMRTFHFEPEGPMEEVALDGGRLFYLPGRHMVYNITAGLWFALPR